MIRSRPTDRSTRRITRSAAEAGRPSTEHLSLTYLRSTKMYSMHEALARDRMREQEQRSRQARLARSLAAQRRWHRVSLRARAAEQRHALLTSQMPVR
jgi:hypothetical protein